MSAQFCTDTDQDLQISKIKKNHFRTRNKVPVTVALSCEYNTVQHKLFSLALGAVHINLLHNINQLSSWDTLIQWSFLHCGSVQPGEKASENIAHGNSILMQRGKFEFELLQIQDDLALG